ncbi:MAG: hypothetical protein ACT4TC_25565 [Myxococcaceae bacterium]
MLRALIVVLLGATLAGCGATVGDACTTVSECGNQLCINNKDYTPGGYCSRQCTHGDDRTCPNGSTCIRNGAGDFDACFRVCQTNSECRTGYTCAVFRGSTQSVCVVPMS